MTITPRPLAAADDALSTLSAAVRPEHRTVVLTAPRGHAAFDHGPCAVPGCLRTRWDQRDLCTAHAGRWFHESKTCTTSRSEWIATASPHILPRACLVEGCRFGRSSSQLCKRHAAHYRKESPGLDAASWAAAAHSPADWATSQCVAPYCNLWAHGGGRLCVSHDRRWREYARKNPGATIEDFAEHTQRSSAPTVDLGELPPRPVLELQYVFQTWVDHSPKRTSLYAWSLVIRAPREAGVSSILDLPAEEWVARTGAMKGLHSKAATVFRWGWDQLDALLNGPDGWDREYPRDVWRLARLGLARHPRRVMSFEPISQPWFRDLAKRWIRHRLATGMAPGTVDQGLAAICELSRYLASRADNPATPADLTRAHLEGWVASVSTRYGSDTTRSARLRDLAGFLKDIHRFEWETTLPASTVLHREDFPRITTRLPDRAISEYVMRQIESPESIAKMTNPAYRLVLELMIRCGLRAVDAVGLDIDCLMQDDESNPYLHYLNHKMKREAYLPIDDELARRVREHQHAARAEFPGTATKLFPSTFANLDGTKSITTAGFQAAFRRWLVGIRPVDEHGDPVHVTPHQFRHTFGTRLINDDVPQHIVQQLMDHVSPQMTNHYARLHDKTVRNAWAKARKINAQGQEVVLDDDHPLAGAQWTRTGLARAKQTLPNGYCGMPIQSDCEHANPCLTCPLFITTPAFLPQHEAQLRTTLTLIDQSEAAGHTRVAEKNRQIAGNLTKIISACNACAGDQVVLGGTPTPNQETNETRAS